VSAIIEGGLAVSAGMTPRIDGELAVRGLVGAEVDLPTARRAAGIAAGNAVTAIAAALGNTRRLRRCLRMTVYVACADGFHDLSAVADGASAVLLDLFGELPVRTAIGVRSLPSNAPVEIELTAAVDD
jgi:enamine deaminase RidA (YjgF/YER057c/UK114 family)